VNWRRSADPFANVPTAKSSCRALRSTITERTAHLNEVPAQTPYRRFLLRTSSFSSIYYLLNKLEAKGLARPGPGNRVPGAAGPLGHVLPRFGNRPLASIRPSEIQAWARGLSDELAPATTELVFRFVFAIFKAAVDDRLIARNPCVGTKLPRRVRAQVIPLETAQVLAVIDAMPERLRAAAVLGAGCGLRQGEALGVTVDRVDFLRRQLVVDRQLLTLTGQAPHLAPPKTPSSVRTLPLADFVLTKLARHVEHFEPGEGGLLFTSASGGPVPRNRFADVWRTAATKVGLPTSATFHDLRHFYASLLKISDVAATASLDMVRDQGPIRDLGFSAVSSAG
jgi:integrase